MADPMLPWWAWVLILAVPAGWLRLVSHELSHVVAAKICGATVMWREFRPWPTKIGGRWYWGVMFREDVDGDDDDYLVGIAPLLKASILVPFWALLAMLWLPLLVFAFWELTDIIHWWRGWLWQPLSDGGRVRDVLRKRAMARELCTLHLGLSGRVTSRDPNDPSIITGAAIDSVSLRPQSLDPILFDEEMTFTEEDIDAWRNLRGSEWKDS